MQEQRTRARAASQFSIDYTETIRLEGSTDFCGYAVTELSSEIVGLYSAGETVDTVSEGADVALILNQTAFYAESGGQVGDKGLLTKGSAVIAISDCRKVGNHHLHIVWMTRDSGWH
jgi:alanyl-tRNA synthetase